MKIAIHGRPFKEEAFSYIKEMLEFLQQKKIKLQVYSKFYEFLKKKGINLECGVYNDRKEMGKVDFVLSIGGDGTLLESVTMVQDRQFPILGINTGRLGFLATTSRNMIIQGIQSVLDKQYTFDDRTLIHVDSDEDIFEGVNFGLNEFAILKRDTSSMIVVHTYVDGIYLNSYWADGLLVSTPTGSTGYSLSVGGPLLLPQTSNFIIAPVSPHNLNVRPIIVSDESVISFKIEGRSKKFLVALDSRSKSVTASVKLSVRKEKFKARLIKLENYNFFDTLRSKLNWGLDLRN